jgi:hypothetical protein
MSGPSVSGGGTIAVETDAMVVAAQRVAATEHGLDGIAARTAVCVALATGAARRQHAETALTLTRRARALAGVVGTGLRTAGIRYGAVEHGVLDAERSLAALAAAVTGGVMRTAFQFAGPAGALAVAGGAVELAGVLAAARILERTAETGRFAPQSDPVLLRSIALVLASLDDGVRGAMLQETPGDLARDDPARPFGTEQVALLASILLHPAGGPLDVTRTEQEAARSPRRLAELADRIPDGAEPGGQVRIERYPGADGPRWIVYIGGTVTFARDSGDEPFDLASDVLGVAHRPTDSERAVLQAMDEAGVGRDEPVLLVGHSQGALNAVRVAQDGGYEVGGVVQFGGPTGQIALPADVPVLALEHDQDLVPVLGGTAVSGSAGLRRLVIRRALPDDGFGTATSRGTAQFPAHDLGAYRRTLHAAESSGDARVQEFARRLGPFLDGREGVASRWRAGGGRRSRTSALVAARQRAEDQRHDPADDAEDERAQHAPPEAVHVEAEADHAADPRDEQEEQPVHDQGDEAEREQVEGERHDADRGAEHPVHEAEDQAEQQEGEDDRHRVVGPVGHDAHAVALAERREEQGGEPQRDRVDDRSHHESAHPSTMAAGVLHGLADAAARPGGVRRSRAWNRRSVCGRPPLLGPASSILSTDTVIDGPRGPARGHGGPHARTT